MTDYVCLKIQAVPCSETVTDLLADDLANLGFESFVANENGLEAYIRSDLYDKTATAQCLKDFSIPTQLSWTDELIEGQDWNSEWEKNYFKPIVIGDCTIRSSFHTDVAPSPIEIIIDPRMAFGTGHHQTTALIVGTLLSMELKGKSVIDMGAGTGILSILAAKLGADCAGIEIDPNACENARENALLNDAKVDYIAGDATALEPLCPADVFLANINRNVILADLADYADKLKPGGTMVLSGFYSNDVPLIERAAKLYGLEIKETKTGDDDWTALILSKKG